MANDSMTYIIDASTPILSTPSMASEAVAITQQAESVRVSHVLSTSDGALWGYINNDKYNGWVKLEEPNGDKNYQSASGSSGTSQTPSAEAAEAANPGGSGVENNSDTTDSNNDYLNVVNEFSDENILQIQGFKGTLQLFGCPFQFVDYVDTRIGNISSTVGHKFVENILSESVIATFIPGVPSYLPAKKDKQAMSRTLLEKLNDRTQMLDNVINADISDENLRYFDFKADYARYMQYANALCRLAAVMLGIGDQKLNDTALSFSEFMWQNYRYTGENFETMTGQVVNPLLTKLSKFNHAAAGSFYTTVSELANGIGASDMSRWLGQSADYNKSIASALQEVIVEEEQHDMSDRVTNMSCVQFYIQPPTAEISVNNNTSTSKLEGLLNTASDTMKEIAFVTNSTGVLNMEELNEYSDSALSALSSYMGNTNTTIGGVLDRILQVGSNTLKGENVIFPEIYQNSSNGSGFQITINLKSAYGDRVSYYLNILVPLLHLVALAYPKQATANTYASPFLIKAYVPGMYHCNMGIVSSLSISKRTSDGSVNVDGLPMELEVNLNIQDLYSDMSIASSSEPALFLMNGSLVDFLAVNCGVDIIEPHIQEKIDAIVETYMSSLKDVGFNLGMTVVQGVGLEEKINSLLFMM